MSDVSDRHDLTGKIVIQGRTPVFIGSYSIVYSGNLNEQRVAVKIIRSVGALHTMRRKVLRERTVWEALEHPNILPFYGYADDTEFEPFGAFISPWCSNGDAGRFLERHGPSLQVSKRVNLWKGVLNGVAFLHGCSPVVVHGDLKPGNILIDDEGNPRICDFGLVRLIQEEGSGGMTTTTEYTGTERYLAPELLDVELAVPTTASDVHALGCLGLEFIYLKKPYAHHLSNYRGFILVDIRKGLPPARRDVVTDDLNDPYWKLIEACWNPQPLWRPPVTRLLQSLNSIISSNNISTPQNTPNEATNILQDIHGMHTTVNEEKVTTTARDTDSKKDTRKVALRARTLMDYKGEDPEELSFAKGEILEILEKLTTWCRARKEDGTSGIAPSICLALLPQREVETSDGPENGPPESPKDEPTVLCRAKAVFDYIASDDGLSELSFKKGEVLDIIDNSGKWWYARKADGVYGNVPSNFMVVI